MVPFIILILFKFVATLTPKVYHPDYNYMPTGFGQKRNSYNYTATDQGFNYGYQAIGYPTRVQMKDPAQGQYYTDREDAETRNNTNMETPIPLKEDTYNSLPSGQAYGYQNSTVQYYTNQRNSEKMNDAAQGQYYTSQRHDAATGNNLHGQAVQSETKQNQEARDISFSNTFLIVIGVIALLPTFILAGFLLRKRFCVRKQSVQDPGRQERCLEAQYEELNYQRAGVDIANRPPYPLPQHEQNIYEYTHYNKPYDHRIIPPPARPRNGY